MNLKEWKGGRKKRGRKKQREACCPNTHFYHIQTHCMNTHLYNYHHHVFSVFPFLSLIYSLMMSPPSSPSSLPLTPEVWLPQSPCIHSLSCCVIIKRLYMMMMILLLMMHFYHQYDYPSPLSSPLPFTLHPSPSPLLLPSPASPSSPPSLSHTHKE